MNSSETMVAAFALLGLVLYVFGVLALQAREQATLKP